MVSQIASRSTSDGARSHWSVSASMVSSLYQPNQPVAPRPRIWLCSGGAKRMVDGPQVCSTDQPPFSTGSRELRRCATVPQSVAAISTFSPIFTIRSWVTSPRGPTVTRSVGLSRTTFSPLYPDAFRIARARSMSPRIAWAPISLP